MTIERESDLYAPIKGYLEGLGFTVRGEVGKCDMAAVQGELLVGVELKIAFGLNVLYQALERLTAFDLVYVGVGVPDGKKARANWDAQQPQAVRLCRMLGVGLITVRDGRVAVEADPSPYQPRKSPKMRVKMLREFTRRSGDHNVGGTTKRPRITAYREDALRCAHALVGAGATAGKADMALKDIRTACGVERASNILRDNVYGWFEKTDRGRYAVSPAGVDALFLYADVVKAQAAMKEAAEAAGEPPAPQPVRRARKKTKAKEKTPGKAAARPVTAKAATAKTAAKARAPKQAA